MKKTSSSGSNPSYQVSVTTDGVAAATSYSLLERAAIRLLFGQTGVAGDSDAQAAAGQYFATHPWSAWSPQTDYSAGTVEEFEVAHETAELNDAQEQALALKGEASINNEGDLVITLGKAGSDDEGYLAVFNMTCQTDIQSGILAAPDSQSNAEIKYATITWKPSAVEKG